MQNIRHWDTILAVLKNGKKVEFEWHYAIWNEKQQCGWLHRLYLKPEYPLFNWDKTFYGWGEFTKVLKDSICNDYYKEVDLC